MRAKMHNSAGSGGMNIEIQIRATPGGDCDFDLNHLWLGQPDTKSFGSCASNMAMGPGVTFEVFSFYQYLIPTILILWQLPINIFQIN